MSAFICSMHDNSCVIKALLRLLLERFDPDMENHSSLTVLWETVEGEQRETEASTSQPCEASVVFLQKVVLSVVLGWEGERPQPSPGEAFKRSASYYKTSYTLLQRNHGSIIH